MRKTKVRLVTVVLALQLLVRNSDTTWACKKNEDFTSLERVLPEKYRTTDSDEIKATERLRKSIESKSCKKGEKLHQMSISKLTSKFLNKITPIVFNIDNLRMLHMLMSVEKPNIIGSVNPTGGPFLTPANLQKTATVRTSPVVLSSDPHVNSGKISMSGFSFPNKNSGGTN